MMRGALVAASVVVALAQAAPAFAEERMAIVIGHNRGDSDEARLRFAEADAEKFGRVLRELGGVPPENVVTLLGEDADTVRAALIRVNERLRTLSGNTTSLYVFYSGHADANALHLGGTHLALREVEALVHGSPATFRLLVVDACRSGALTRVKGGTAVAPTPIRVVESSPGEGAVFLTASAASEDAQESDDIRGSFFTHYLVSGLRGAADANGDGAVDLDEAYRFAYAQTLRASSRSLGGTQHPTYRHDLRGRGDVVLTRWRGHRRHGLVRLPDRHAWLLFQGRDGGPVVAEVVPGHAARTLAVPAGDYFVRGRTEEGLLEGAITVAEGTTVNVAQASLTTTAYARLVRKGGADAPDAVHGVQGGYRLRTPLEEGGDLCHGGYLGYVLELENVNLGARLGGCLGGFANRSVDATAFELDAELRLGRAFDLPWVTLELSLGLGASWLGQRFESRALTPDRDALAGHGDVSLGISKDILGPLYVNLEAAGMLYLLQRERSTGAELLPEFAFRASGGLGYRF